MPKRRRRGFGLDTYVASDSGIQAGIRDLSAALQYRREAPQRAREEAREEEGFQSQLRQRGLQEALHLLSLGSKQGAADVLTRLGISVPTRDVTTRGFEREVGPGEDPGGLTEPIPYVARTRRDIDLETPREKHAREQTDLEQREERGERRRFALGQESAVAQERRVRERPPTTSDELGVSLFRKAAKGEPLAPQEQEFVVDFVRAQRKDPKFKQEFEGRITEKLSLGGEAALAPHERDYYLSNMQRRDPGAAARTEARAEEGLGLQRAAGARATESQASNERNRVFDDLDRARQIIEKKHARRRETVPLGQNRQQALAQIDAAEDAELSQVTERHKKRYPKYSADIEAQFGGGGSGRPAPRPSIMDLFKQGPTRQGTPRG